MRYMVGKKWLGSIFTINLLLAVIGATTLSITESFQFDNTTGNSRTGSNDYYNLNKHSFDWLACEAVAINKACESSSSPLRNGAVRMFIPSEINNAAVFFAESPFQAAANNYVPNIKNTILLKLRL